MAYIWFNSVLEALGKRINFESISNAYGNGLAKDVSKLIQAANPLTKHGVANNSGVMSLTGQIKIVESKDVTSDAKVVESTLGDLSWAGDLFK